MSLRTANKWWLAAALVLSLVGCDRARNEGTLMTATAATITDAEWQALIQRRVVFGHQSVGQNILDGVQSLAAQASVNLPILKSRTPAMGGGIVHFLVGQNEDPSSKLKDFASTLESYASRGPDIALVKFCYIDFDGGTDAKQLAEQYNASLDRLSQQFRKTTFVAITAPLTVAQTGPKAWIKRLLGRTPSGYVDNARRQEFNNLLRARYDPQGRLFDLARIEAEGADAHEYQGQPIEVLNPLLTNDDGHLNTNGQQVVATRLIKYLAAVPKRQ